MKISVITVCYNASNTIADTLRSVREQKYRDIEHIIVDGGSTDQTLEIIENEGKHVAELISEKDSGIYDAMNKGFGRVRGEIIGFLNADDLYADSEVLVRVAKAFEDDPNLEACFGDLIYVSEDNRKVVRYWKSRPFVMSSFARGWCPAHPTFYIRRSALERLGQFDLTFQLAADTEFMMRYLECGVIRSAYLPYIQVRMRVGGATNQSWRNIVRQNREILQALRQNSIPYSLASFVLHKLASRFRQRFAAFMMKELT